MNVGNMNLSFTLALNRLLLVAAICLLDLGSALAQTLSGTTDLKESPSDQAKTVKSAPANTSIKLIRRQGFWAEIEALGNKGWVKLSNVQLGGGAGLAAGLDTGRMGKGNIVSTSAARGLSSKELTGAKPDFNGFEQFRQLTVTVNAADAFAQSANLQTRMVALVSTPLSAAGGARDAASGGGKSGTRKKSKSDEDDDDD